MKCPKCNYDIKKFKEAGAKGGAKSKRGKAKVKKVDNKKGEE